MTKIFIIYYLLFHITKTPDTEYIVSGVFMKKRILCIIFAVILITVSLSIRMTEYYSAACDTFAEAGINSVVTRQINNKLAEKLAKNQISYNKLANVVTLSNGRIASIIIDTAKINILANELSSEILEYIASAENDFGIPLGNTLGIKYLSGKGPKIDVRINCIGTVSYEINSELLSGGLNQTLHRISIRFDVFLNCVAPFHETKSSITTTLVIAETLIVGEVPQVLLSGR